MQVDPMKSKEVIGDVRLHWVKEALAGVGLHWINLEQLKVLVDVGLHWVSVDSLNRSLATLDVIGSTWIV